ncbi:hypothetical protein [Planctomicrobium piriforme]|uniref:Uncharacterized protein n=1 Tax=Planctomicrobium piriforme TaxID=1576369 RepID=A0A1I3EI60_9PLAN|nr:hypothetical protein [Planctomicrobium piriforme]SFH98401.1 hypothetical protein SAMN05421753_104224 [Planctomicrobium piriforme]
MSQLRKRIQDEIDHLRRYRSPRPSTTRVLCQAKAKIKRQELLIAKLREELSEDAVAAELKQ